MVMGQWSRDRGGGRVVQAKRLGFGYDYKVEGVKGVTTTRKSRGLVDLEDREGTGKGEVLRSARELRGDGVRVVYIHEITCQESEAFIGNEKRGKGRVEKQVQGMSWICNFSLAGGEG
jgi:hypothetical protein